MSGLNETSIQIKEVKPYLTIYSAGITQNVSINGHTNALDKTVLNHSSNSKYYGAKMYLIWSQGEVSDDNLCNYFNSNATSYVIRSNSRNNISANKMKLILVPKYDQRHGDLLRSIFYWVRTNLRLTSSCQITKYFNGITDHCHQISIFLNLASFYLSSSTASQLTSPHTASCRLAKSLATKSTSMNRKLHRLLTCAAKLGRADVCEILLMSGAVQPDFADNEGWSPLRHASFNGNLRCVNCLLTYGATVDWCGDSTRRTALRSAAWAGHTAVIERFLSAGAPWNLADTDGRTPLMVASFKCQLDAVRLILRHCQDKNVDDRDNEGHTALILTVCGLGFIKDTLATEAVVQDLVSAGADVNAYDGIGYSALHYAALHGSIPLTRYLLSIGASCDIAANYKTTNLSVSNHPSPRPLYSDSLTITQPNNATPTSNWSPLAVAVDAGHLDLVEWMLNAGFHNDINTPVDNTGCTLMSLAASLPGYQSGDIAEALLSHGADAEQRDNNDWLPLHQAAYNGTASVLNVLCSVSVESIDAVDGEGRSPLALASIKENLNCVKTLFSRGASINQSDTSGSTPLHHALLNDNLSTAAFLIDNGADINAVDCDRRSPLHLSVLADNEDYVRLLLDRGANINLRDNASRTALLLAAHIGNATIVQLLLTQSESQNLISVSNDVVADCSDNLSQYQESNPAEDSSSHGRSHCANNESVTLTHLVNLGDSAGRTPLLVAVWKAFVDIIDLLCKFPFTDVNCADSEGATGLHVAAYLNRSAEISIASTLLDHGANWRLRDNKGRSPIDISRQVNNIPFLDLMLSSVVLKGYCPEAPSPDEKSTSTFETDAEINGLSNAELPDCHSIEMQINASLVQRVGSEFDRGEQQLNCQLQPSLVDQSCQVSLSPSVSGSCCSCCSQVDSLDADDRRLDEVSDSEDTMNQASQNKSVTDAYSMLSSINLESLNEMATSYGRKHYLIDPTHDKEADYCRKLKFPCDLESSGYGSLNLTIGDSSTLRTIGSVCPTSSLGKSEHSPPMHSSGSNSSSQNDHFRQDITPTNPESLSKTLPCGSKCNAEGDVSKTSWAMNTSGNNSSNGDSCLSNCTSSSTESCKACCRDAELSGTNVSDHTNNISQNFGIYENLPLRTNQFSRGLAPNRYNKRHENTESNKSESTVVVRTTKPDYTRSASARLLTETELASYFRFSDAPVYSHYISPPSSLRAQPRTRPQIITNPRCRPNVSVSPIN